jgi:RNA polymerase sigma-70 factor (sigma-E family)
VNKKQSRAFEAFVESEGDRLLRIAVLMTSNYQLAEDATQRTLERLAARWDRVEHPKAFCRRVLTNLLTDDARAAARRPREQPLSLAQESPDPVAQDGLRAAELRPALLSALNSLTPHQRAIVALRYFDDRSDAEVSEILGVAVGTVKSTASRAVAQLRTHPSLAGLFCPADFPAR